MSSTYLSALLTGPSPEPNEVRSLIYWPNFTDEKTKKFSYFAKVTELGSDGTKIPNQSSSRAQTMQHYNNCCFGCYFSNEILDSIL